MVVLSNHIYLYLRHSLVGCRHNASSGLDHKRADSRGRGEQQGSRVLGHAATQEVMQSTWKCAVIM